MFNFKVLPMSIYFKKRNPYNIENMFGSVKNT
ncbi:unknown [Bacteroides sp. CAG:598]|nr:unknown [Bacteroides sp. CAG:598]